MPIIESDRNAIIRRLRQASLSNLVLLKYLQTFPSTALQVVEGDHAATMVLTDHRFSAWDRKTYPDVAKSVMVSSTSPDLTRALLPLMPPDRPIVIKLSSDADRAIFAEHYPLERRTAFLSFTGQNDAAPDPDVQISTNAAEAPFPLFALQGHSADWLTPLLQTGRAFVYRIAEGGEIVSTCFAFRIDGDIWEIGGLYTLPAHRGKGLAFRIVQTALAHMQQQSLTIRYQVSETNLASIRLAEALGLSRYFTMTHYLSA